MEPRESGVNQHVAEREVRTLLACLEALLAVDRLRPLRLIETDPDPQDPELPPTPGP
jgi:hypothetical protein